MSQLLTTGGLLPGAAEAPEVLSPRQRGLRLGAKVLFASLVLIPLCFMLSVMADSPLPLLLAALVFLAGALRMLYARLFESERKVPAPYSPALEPAPRGAALPPHRAPVEAPRPGAKTGELAEPPSVTEHTTRFLDR